MMRTLSLLFLLTAACEGPGISEDTDIGDPDSDTAVDGTDTDTDADTDADSDSGTGQAVNTSALENKTYVIPFDDVNWISPSGVSLISDQIPVDYILLHIASADAQAETIEPVAGLGIPDGNGVAQDPCQTTFGFGDQSFTNNPMFNVGPTELTFPVQGQDFTIENAFIGATFVEAGDAIEDITISGRLDSRPLDSLVPGGDVCNLVALLGSPCTACPDGAIECLDVLLQVARAEADDNLVFDPDIVPACR